MSQAIKLFGIPRIFCRGDWLEPRPSKPLCLLYYAAYHGSWLSREKLSFLLWSDASEISAQQNLRRLIHRAKELPFTNDLEVEKTRLRWSVDTDLKAFRKAIAEQVWQEAVALYTGPFLEGFSLKNSGGFEAWLELERRDLEVTWRDATLKYVGVLETEEAFGEAAGQLETLLRNDRLAEDIVQRYLRNAYLADERDAALDAFEQFSKQLKQELDLVPLEATLNLVQTIHESRALGQAPVLRAKAHPSVPVSILRPPKLVGREEEMSRIRATTLPVTLIAGEAGVGKSRLMAELAPSALSLKCQEGLQSVPYYPVTTLIRSLLARDVPVPDLEYYLEDLARLVPEVAPHTVPQAADPETGRSRLFEALSRYFEAVTQAKEKQGFHLLMDDLQWADESTLAFFVYLANRKTVKLLGTYRIHEVADILSSTIKSLNSNHTLTNLKLDALASHEVADLIASLMGIEEGPPIFSAWLHKSTGGNPVFILETLKSLFEAGTLRIEGEDWHTDIDDVTGDYSELRLPKRVTDVIQRRVEKLSPETLRTLQVASVIGEGFTHDTISSISGLSEWAVADGLDTAEGHAIISNHSFCHDLLRQSIYATTPATRRRLLHTKVAEVLTDTVETSVVAEHWFRADELEKAYKAWLNAALTLRKGGGHIAAIGMLEKAAELTLNTPHQVKFQLLIARLYRECNQLAKAEMLVDSLLKGNLEPALRALALETKSMLLLFQGEVVRGEEIIIDAIKLNDPVLENELNFNLNITLGLAKGFNNNQAEAVKIWEQELPKLRQQGPSFELCQLLVSLGGNYDRIGQPEIGLGYHRQGVAVAKKLKSDHLITWATYSILCNYLETGVDVATELLPQAEALLKKHYSEGSDQLRDVLVAIYIDLGDLEDAHRHLTEFQKGIIKPLESMVLARQAEYHFKTNSPQLALDTLREAVNKLAGIGYAMTIATVLLKVAVYGDQALLDRITPYLERFEQIRSGVFPSVQKKLEDALVIRGIHLKFPNL